MNKIITYKKYLISTFVILSLSLNTLAEEQYTQPVKVYKYLGMKADNYSDLIDQIKNTAPYLGDNPQTLGSARPADNAIIINGEPNKLLVDRFNSDGDLLTAIGIDVLNSCPPSASLTTENTGDNSKSAACKISDGNSDLCKGNPIDIGARKKIETEYDYVAKNSYLAVVRRYNGHNSGWTIEAPPYLSGNLENLSATHPYPINSDYGYGYAGGLNACPNPFEITLTEMSGPLKIEQVNKKFCSSYINGISFAAQTTDDPPPSLILRFGTRQETFVVPQEVSENRENQHFRVAPGTEFLSVKKNSRYKKIIYLIDSSGNPVWQLSTRSGDLLLFNASGYLFREEFTGGGHLSYEYNFAPWYLSQKTDHTGRSINYTYDSYYRLTEVTLPAGTVIQYKYDETEPDRYSAVLNEVIWPSGRSVTYLYNEPLYTYNQDLPNALTGKLDSNGTRIGTYYYKNNKAFITEKSEDLEYYKVESGLNYSKVTDGRDVSTTYYFYENEPGELKLQRTTQASGSGCSAASDWRTYDSEGLMTKYKNFNGYMTHYHYNEFNQEISRIEGLPKNDNIDYFSKDANNVIPEGARMYTQSWYSDGLLAATTSPLKKTTRVYNQEVNPWTNTPENCVGTGGENRKLVCLIMEEVTTDQNGSLGQNAELDNEVISKIQRMTYNQYGQIKSYSTSYKVNPDDIPSIRLTTYDYYPNTTEFWNKGDLKRITNPLGQTTEFTKYNQDGRPTEIVDANSVIRNIYYDDEGNAEKQVISDGSSAVTAFKYHYDNNNLLKTISQNGITTYTYHYDKIHRLSWVNDIFGGVLGFSYTKNSDVESISVQNVDSETVFHANYVLDNLNRIESVSSGTEIKGRYFYDPQGNLTSYQTGKSQTYSYEYDALNRLKAIAEPNTAETQIFYNALDQVVKVIDAESLETVYHYNGFGELTQRISPDTGTTDYTYDSAGNLTSKADARGIVALYSYDALNRVTSIEYPNDTTQNITYEYDDTSNGNYGIGRLTAIIDASGETRFAYDYLGNLLSKTTTIATQTFTSEYQYDAFGRLQTQVYPSGRLVHYSYDALSRIHSITTQANSSAPLATVITDVSYLPYGPATQWTYGNGIVHTTRYDLDYRVSSIEDDGSSPLYHLSYGYDANNNIETLDNLVNSVAAQVFSYDAVDRLDTAQGNYGALDYDYDKVGNRTQKLHAQGGNTNTESYSYALTSHQLQAVTNTQGGNRTFSYDANGNVLTDTHSNSLVWEYDDTNRPKAVTVNGERIEYRHNALGQRVFKQHGNTTTYYHYDEAGKLIAVSDEQGNTLEEHVWFNNTLVASLIEPVTAVNTSSSVLLEANFDNQDLSGWQIVDNGAKMGPSSWYFDNGALCENSNIYTDTGPSRPGTYAAYSSGASWSDYEASVTLLSSDDDGIGLLFRYVDDNNYYRFSMDSQRAYRRLVKKQNGVFTVLFEDNIPYILNQPYGLRVSAQGNSLSIWLDNQLWYQGSDTSHAQGSIALYAWGEQAACFNDLSVNSLEAAQ